MGNGWILRCFVAATILWLAGCAVSHEPPPPVADANPAYIIGPGDTLEIFVWRNSEVSNSVTVRPDGKISTPLVEDLQAAGMTPTELARNVEAELAKYLKEPLVTVIMRGFVGPYSQQIRVVGEAAAPRVLSYRENMSVLDVMIAVGGLTEFASGNKAMIVREVDGKRQQFVVRLDDLIRDGDISANVPVLPGDILIIPESWL
ncbi:MAG: polysaccharide export protein [Gammaproteobacteria bacterium]|nr:polysaccharide export protein [Gammaproteobacteria bacterium]MCF6363934.1 polysaccharide export protein [Gammaproteobacteria bacterium]